MAQNFKKYLLITIGSLSLAIGFIGIFIPILPTTPFLLLSACCYLRSSKRMYNWLIHHKVLGIYIYNYLTYKAIPRNAKIVSLLFLWITLLISLSIISNLYLRLFLLVIGLGVSFHLITLKTLVFKELQYDEAQEGQQ